MKTRQLKPFITVDPYPAPKQDDRGKDDGKDY